MSAFRRGHATPVSSEIQPYAPLGPGELNRGYLSRVLPILGQGASSTREDYLMHHGRQLSGLGDFQTNAPYDPTFKSDAVQKLEVDDDVDGSGIFDDYGFKGTVNRSLGIFADHPNMPGYVQREVEFSPSKQVQNMSSGAAVIYVPGGGMSYIDHGHDHLDRAGFPTTRIRKICPAGPMVRSTLPTVPFETDYHVVADNVGQSTPTTTISANADSATTINTQAMTQMPTSPSDDTGSLSRPTMPVGRPQRGLAPTTSQEPMARVGQTQRVTMASARGQAGSQRGQMVSNHQNAQQPVTARQGMTRPTRTAQSVPSAKQAPQNIRGRAPAALAVRRHPSAFGDDTAPTPLSSYIVGGILVGAAAAVAASLWGKR